MMQATNPEQSNTTVQQLLWKAANHESTGQGTSANKEYMLVLREICDKDPINAAVVTKYVTLLVQGLQNGESGEPAVEGQQKPEIAEAQKVFESALRYNASQVTLWESYLTFLQDHHQYLGADADDTIKAIFERAIQCVGRHMKSAPLWQQYINFETSQLHMGFSFLLCYVALQTLLLDYESISQKYIEQLNNYFDSIEEDFKGADFANSIPDKYQEHFKKLEPMMKNGTASIKQLILLAQNQLLPTTTQQVAERIPFEDAIKQIHEQNRSLVEEKQAWLNYIDFEVAREEPLRARLLYERALISLDLDIQFWLAYINFIQKTLKDPSLVRAKFESRRASENSQNVGDLVELMIEHALFEEEQQQVPKARMIYETLTNEVAPGYVKATLAFIGFERRMGSNERVKELFYKALNAALAKKDAQAVTYIAMQYARFLAFKRHDVFRAVDVMDQATSEIRTSKVLFLSQINLLKHLEGQDGSQLVTSPAAGMPSSKSTFTTRTTGVFERALFDSELNMSDKRDIAFAYLDYMRESASNVGQIKAVQAKLIDNKLLEANSVEQQDFKMPDGSILGKRQRTK